MFSKGIQMERGDIRTYRTEKWSCVQRFVFQIQFWCQVKVSKWSEIIFKQWEQRLKITVLKHWDAQWKCNSFLCPFVHLANLELHNHRVHEAMGRENPNVSLLIHIFVAPIKYKVGFHFNKSIA